MWLNLGHTQPLTAFWVRAASVEHSKNAASGVKYYSHLLWRSAHENATIVHQLQTKMLTKNERKGLTAKCNVVLPHQSFPGALWLLAGAPFVWGPYFGKRNKHGMTHTHTHTHVH